MLRRTTIHRVRQALTSVRGLHVSTHTVHYPTPEAVSSLIPRDTTVFFSLSATLDADSLSRILATIPNRSAGGFHISETPSIALTILQPEEGERLQTWYSSSSGRAPPQVGKWQRLGTSWTEDKRGSTIGELEKVLDGDGWEGVWRTEDGGVDLSLDSSTKSVLCFTDGQPQPVLSALDAYGATTLGLLSAPTPFLTGRPHTLFHDGTAYSKGSVGIALSVPPNKAEIAYGLEPLDKEYIVATSRGNLLLSLEGSPNPTQTLIAALQRRDKDRPAELRKDEEFWMEIGDGAGTRIVRILSGDPSRGALSLEMEGSLRSGQTVRFMQKTFDAKAHSALRLPLSHCMRFAVIPRAEGFAEPPNPGETAVYPGFAVASEDGFIYGLAGSKAGIVTVPGATCVARWWA